MMSLFFMLWHLNMLIGQKTKSCESTKGVIGFNWIGLLRCCVITKNHIIKFYSNTVAPTYTLVKKIFYLGHRVLLKMKSEEHQKACSPRIFLTLAKLLVTPVAVSL